MKPEEELVQLRAENQALRKQLEQRDSQLVQRDELIAQLQQRLQAIERCAKQQAPLEELTKDGWQSSWQYDCGHGLCHVHVLRELTFVEEEQHQVWPGQMKELLLIMKAQVEDATASGQSALPLSLYQRLVACYGRLLVQGYLENLPASLVTCRLPPKRGRRKQTPALNWLDRLRQQQEAILAFLYDFAVPFDNSLAERDLRMVKVQQKVSGCFRSFEGARAFARIRGYLSSLRKQGLL